MRLIFATNNKHKVEEIKAALTGSLEVVSLNDAGIEIEIPEPHETLEDNAKEKGKTIFSITKQNCFSEDTGLEATALNGGPGVHSARYAGEEHSSEKNIAKLLSSLENHTNRKAQFRTVIFLLLNGKEYYFEGVCKGQITLEPKGNSGFGYDPVFVPDGSDKTFGQMDLTEKNIYSHRKKALDKLVTFLNQHSINS